MFILNTQFCQSKCLCKDYNFVSVQFQSLVSISLFIKSDECSLTKSELKLTDVINKEQVFFVNIRFKTYSILKLPLI